LIRAESIKQMIAYFATMDGFIVVAGAQESVVQDGALTEKLANLVDRLKSINTVKYCLPDYFAHSF